MLLQSFGHGEPLSALLAYVWLLPSVHAAVVLQQSDGFAELAAIRAGVTVRAKVSLLVRGELR